MTEGLGTFAYCNSGIWIESLRRHGEPREPLTMLSNTRLPQASCFAADFDIRSDSLGVRINSSP